MAKFLDLDGLRRVAENVRLRLDCKQDQLIGLPGQVVGFGVEGVTAVTISPGDNTELKQDGNDLTISAVVSNPNMLDNWYFLDPINQKNLIEWTEGYGIDRWYSEGISSTVEATGLTLVGNSSMALIQRWEVERINNLVGKPLTLSLLTTTGLSYCHFQIEQYENGGYQAIAQTNLLSSRIESYGPLLDDYQMVRIVPKHNERITVIAAKLEIGSVQTLAHQDTQGNWLLNDPPPNKALELAKCQRYYRIVDNMNVVIGSSIQNERFLTSSISFTDMRISPMASLGTVDGQVGIINGIQYLSPSELGFVGKTKSSIIVYIPATVASGPAVGGQIATIYKIMLDANV